MFSGARLGWTDLYKGFKYWNYSKLCQVWRTRLFIFFLRAGHVLIFLKFFDSHRTRAFGWVFRSLLFFSQSFHPCSVPWQPFLNDLYLLTIKRLKKKIIFALSIFYLSIFKFLLSSLIILPVLSYYMEIPDLLLGWVACCSLAAGQIFIGAAR